MKISRLVVLPGLWVLLAAKAFCNAWAWLVSPLVVLLDGVGL